MKIGDRVKVVGKRGLRPILGFGLEGSIVSVDSETSVVFVLLDKYKETGTPVPYSEKEIKLVSK